MPQDLLSDVRIMLPGAASSEMGDEIHGASTPDGSWREARSTDAAAPVDKRLKYGHLRDLELHSGACN